MPHTNPRISTNKLGEYMDASSTRRRTIIKNQKNPPGEFVTARYNDALSTIREFFFAGASDDSIIQEKILELRDDYSGTEWARQDRQLSADALEGFLDLIDQINLGGAVAVPGDHFDSDALTIAGVSVSVRPEILLLESADSTNVIGGIKFSFNKINALSKLSCEFVATILRRYLVNFDGGGTVDYTRCFGVGVPSALVVTAPRAFVRRMSELEAACEEIALRWPTLSL